MRTLPDMSVNRNALKLVRDLCEGADECGVIVKKDNLGAWIIDAGIEAKGSILAGKAITEICLGGLGEVAISSTSIGGVELPSISVCTDYPAVSTLGCQLAGWRVKIGDYSAVCSGPARALALKPKSIYEKIGYKDESDVAVLVLETGEEPPEEVIMYISDSCHVKPDNLFLILVPTQSLAGFTQISGRAVETGVHKMADLGFDPRLITNAWGSAPIMPVHSNYVEAMGRTNDAILYGGVVYYAVNYEDDEALKVVVDRSVSSSSRQYGRPFAEIFREAGLDFYKIDPNVFAPAVVTVSNAKTGKTFTAGKTNADVLKQSMNL